MAEGGEVLDTVALDRGGFACMLGRWHLARPVRRRGGVAGRGRLMTHTEWDGQVLRVPVDVPGAGWPAR